MKQSSISYLKFDDKSSCIIASLSQRNDTQVIYIDQIMGTLLFYGIKGYDVFNDKESAYKFVSKNRKLVQCIDAHSILGYVFSANCCHLILIEKEKPLFPLFDKHMVYAIEKVIFIDIPVEIRCPKTNIVNIESLKKYPFNFSHYFCPTLDLSKDFGSLTNTVRTCWNQQLIQPFKRFFSIVPNLCVSVFQGVASYTPFVEINAGILFMSSRLFPPLLPKPGKHHSTELGVTCNEYFIDIYLIKNIGNDFEVLNHTIQVGDFPFNWSSDQNYNKSSIDSPEEIKKLTKAFIQRQKALFNYDNITFVNFMSKVGIENDLSEALNNSLNQLNSSKELIGHIYEQDEVEWIQSMKDTALLDDLVQNYWPTASSKIKKYGFTRSFISNLADMQSNVNELQNENAPYDCQVRYRQKGVCRFLYDFSFDREIVGIFFYVMKLLEIMCLDEFNLNFPEKLVIPLQINTFLHGFVFFTSKFLLEFNLYLSNFGNLPIGDLEKLIYEYMKSPTDDIISYQINYQNFLEAATFLKNISAPSIFAVTQSPSSFVMTKNIGNQILRPLNSLIEIKNEQPLVICLAEPCYVKYIILRNTTAIQVSISGGLRLNRTIKIASKINLPWVPKAEQKMADPYIFIDLESQSSIYDNEYRPHDYEKIRFLILKFKTFMKDPLKMNSLFVFGSSKGLNFGTKKISFTNLQLQGTRNKGLSTEPILNPAAKVPKDSSDSSLALQNSQTENVLKPKNPDTQNSMSSQNSQSHQNPQKSQNQSNPTSPQNNQKEKKGSKQPKNISTPPQSPQQQSNAEGKSKIDKIIHTEKNRLLKKEDYFEYQKILISKNISLDSYDLEKIINPNKPDKEPRKNTCTKCQSKDMCTDCANCKRPFCKKCMKTILIEMKEIPFCEECLSKRRQYLLEVEKLKALQYESIKDLYPFISRHNEQLNLTENKPLMYLKFILPSSVSPISDFSGFGDINRPLISTFAFEPPIPQKIMTRLPECLFTSNINWQFESNLAPLTIIFTAKCKVVALHIACFSKLEVDIEGAKPSHLTFDPPGCIQKVEFIGNYANIILSGAKIELRNIRFFGVPIFQKVDRRNLGNQNLSPSKPRSLMKIVPQSSQFSKEMSMHEYSFNGPYYFLAIKFSKISLMPPEIIAEFKTEKTIEFHHISLAKIIQNSNDSPVGIVLFSKPFNASNVRIFYPRLPQQLAANYANEVPDLMVLQKAKPQK